MKRVLKWILANSPSINLLFVSFAIVGGMSLFQLRRELFPDFQSETIKVSMSYPGSSPEDVEKGLSMKIEEAVRSVSGIRKVTSLSAEGMAVVTLETNAGSRNATEILNDVRSAIDQVQTFPVLARRPEVKLQTRDRSSVRLGVVSQHVGPQVQGQLRKLAEEIREGLLEKRTISNVTLDAVPDFQIVAEVSEQSLRSYGLSLQDVAGKIKRENHQLPGGVLRSQSQELLLRGDNQKVSSDHVANIPVISQEDGTIVRVGDLGRVTDGFSDSPSLNRINGLPGISMSVKRSSQQDLFAMMKDVQDFLDLYQLPEGYSIVIWGDTSKPVAERLYLLGKNGIVGILLVLVVLTLFLEIRLAFWVALGIPFSILTACSVLLWCDESLNLVSTFAFLIALGVVVDDAIVVGENIYTHRQKGKSYSRAAIDGTTEVFAAVTVSVLTTVIAFMPMFFVSGRLGKLIWILPTVIISMFLASLVESLTVLPCHLSHAKGWAFYWIEKVFFCLRFLLVPIDRLNKFCTAAMQSMIDKYYRSGLTFVLKNRLSAVSVAIGALIFTGALVAGGRVPFVLFATEDSSTVVASITFPDGTPFSVTKHWVNHLESSFGRAVDRRGISSFVKTVHVKVGSQASTDDQASSATALSSNQGSVEIDLVDSSQRSVSSAEVVAWWRESCGTVPGVESLRFSGSDRGPGGTAIQFVLSGNAESEESLGRASEEIQTRLRQYDGVFDIRDDLAPGKWELQYRVKPNAASLGVQSADLAESMRAAYYGEEVARLQRGRHEVTLLVRYPKAERSDLSLLDDVRILAPNRSEQALGEIAEMETKRGYSTIRRVDQRRAITISADVDQSVANAEQIIKEFKKNELKDILKAHPALSVSWEGQAQDRTESFQSLFMGFGLALLAMFVLLSFQFQSYFQPLLILAIIPFGCIGAVWGHLLLGMPLTFFSVLGIIALTGVVVNDSIVLVDFANKKIRSGESPEKAVWQAGIRRFRPVVLTSLTTVAGVLPLLLEKSRQAQMLVPMATSLSFGLIFSTVLVLFLVPVLVSMFGIPQKSLPNTEKEIFRTGCRR